MSLDDRLRDRLAEIVQARTEHRESLESLHGSRGGGTSGGVTDDWKANVDRQLTQLHGDVRALLYGLVGGFLFLIAAGAVAYTRLADQIGGIRQELNSSQIEQARRDAKLDLLVERSAPQSDRGMTGVSQATKPGADEGR